MIQFNICHLFAHCEAVSSIARINSFICTQLNVSKYCYVTQFNLTSVICLRIGKWSNSSIRPTDETLTGTTTPGQSKQESNGNEELLQIPQSSRIISASPSDSV